MLATDILKTLTRIVICAVFLLGLLYTVNRDSKYNVAMIGWYKCLIITSAGLGFFTALFFATVFPRPISFVLATVVYFTGIIVPSSGGLERWSQEMKLYELIDFGILVPSTKMLIGDIVGLLCRVKIPYTEIMYCMFVNIKYMIWIYLIGAILRRFALRRRQAKICNTKGCYYNSFQNCAKGHYQC
jgi:hypothetical protein